ncbi:hypothetical protein MBLNU230_g1451t1 [Neophaeotheca triangularis]
MPESAADQSENTPSNATQKNTANPFDTASELEYATSINTDNNALESLATASTHKDISDTPLGLPTTSEGTIVPGTTLQINATKVRNSINGLLFSLDNKPKYLAELRRRNASSKRPEIIVNRRSSSSETEDKEVGSVNFHHWLRDRSAAVEISLHGDDEHSLGGTEEPKPDVRRQGQGAEHAFAFRGRTFHWKLSRGVGEEKVFWRRHMKCVEAGTGEVCAFFTIETKTFGGSGEEKRVGRFEIRGQGVDLKLAELFVVTFAALWVKHRKRIEMNGLSLLDFAFFRLFPVMAQSGFKKFGIRAQSLLVKRNGLFFLADQDLNQATL